MKLFANTQRWATNLRTAVLMAGGDSRILSSGFADYETNRDRLTLRSSRTQSKTERLLILRGCRRCDDGWHWYARQEREGREGHRLVNGEKLPRRATTRRRAMHPTIVINGRQHCGCESHRRSETTGAIEVTRWIKRARRPSRRRLSICLVFSGPAAESQQNPSDPISRDFYIARSL